MCLGAVDELERSVKELAALDAHALSDAELRDAQIDLARVGAAFSAAQARMAVVWDQRRVWDTDGAKSVSYTHLTLPTKRIV